jgi:curved DNA-binding protein CbpA
MADRRPHNPYEVLGIRQDASCAEISRAYRRLARELHPDSRPADSDADDQFRVAAAAYELLSDPARRAAHDHGAAGDQPTRHRPARPAPMATPSTSRNEARSQVRPVGPAYQSPSMFTPSPMAPVRPGPVRIEPLAESARPQVDDLGTWLIDLLQLIRQQARDRRYWTW